MEKTDDASDSGAVVSLDGRVPISDDELSNEPAPSDRTQERAATCKAGTAPSTNVVNTGLWTGEEHRRFLVAFRRHPRMWTKIAACVGTRTKVQVRTHALIIHRKLTTRARKNEEHVRNVAALGTLELKPGASHQIVGIGEEEAEEKGEATEASGSFEEGWANDAEGNIRRGRWTPDEHGRFLSVVEDYGRDWNKIAAVVGTRSALQVRTHAQKWHQKLDKAKAKPSSNQADQNENEDKAELSDYEFKQSEGEPGQIVPSDEDSRKEAGLDQDRIWEGANYIQVQHQEGRENDCPNGRRGHWTKEEHSLFLGALEEHGKDWRRIAAVVKTRSADQVRTHAQKYYQKLEKAKLGSNVARQNEKEMSAKSKSKPVFTADYIRRCSAVTATLPAPTPMDETSEPSRKRRKVCVANTKAGCPAPPHKLGQQRSMSPEIVVISESPTFHARQDPAAGGDSGEWTQEEHVNFLVGTLLYRKDWTKVAEHVKTRSAVQVKTHARDWYMKRWLRQEQERLLEAWSK